MKIPTESELVGQIINPVDSHFFHVALIEPEIPQNTGNIGRTCVGAKSDLHIVGPLPFQITDTKLKRAGLDYWQYLTWHRHQTESDWENKIQNWNRVFFFSTKATKKYYEIEYQKGDWFVFGKETKGLDPKWMQKFPDQFIKIPMYGPIRSFNVATAATVALAEGLRQLDGRGELTD